MFIKKIKIQNFMQLKDVELDLQKNTTLLAGPNNSGKISLILLLKRVLSEKSFTFTKNDINAYDKNIWSNKIYQFLKEILESKTNIDSSSLTTSLVERIFPKPIENQISLNKEILIPEPDIKLQVDYTVEDDISYFANYIMDLDDLHNSFYFMIKIVLNKDSFKAAIKENSDKLLNKLRNNDNDAKKESIINLMLDAYCHNLSSKYFFADKNYESLTEITGKQEFRDLFNFQYITAARPVNDSPDRDTRVLSNDLIDLAKKDVTWEYATKELPDEIFKTFDSAKISSILKKASAAALNKLIDSISQTGGGHTGEIVLDIDVTEENVQNLISKTTAAKFAVSENKIKYLLNESSQGLGYSNLIYMHTQIENFIKSKDELRINFLVIEEPESHMHPQMQYVFSRKLLEQYDKEHLQGLITTHSSEIVRGISIEKLRIIREETLFKSKIYDLSSFVTKLGSTKKVDSKDRENDETIVKDFKSFYEEIGISELVFADMAILFEGDTERLYLKKLISLPEYEILQQKYIAYIQVGGSYAYNFKSLLEFLRIKTLILTDIDYEVHSYNDKNVILSSETSNSTLRKFYKDANPDCQLLSYKVEELYKWIKSNHIVSKTINKALNGKETEEELIYLAFQTDDDNYTRTLEAAMLSKIFQIKGNEAVKRSQWLSHRNESGLKFSIPNNRRNEETGETEDDSEFDLIDILNSTSKGKTDFMYSVILNGLAKKMLPNYIKEGLEWLMKQ